MNQIENIADVIIIIVLLTGIGFALFVGIVITEAIAPALVQEFPKSGNYIILTSLLIINIILNLLLSMRIVDTIVLYLTVFAILASIDLYKLITNKLKKVDY